MFKGRSDFSRQTLTALPNLLTFLRIATIPVIVYLLSSPVTLTSFNVTFLLFVLASITDYLDGILARRHNMVTSMGKLLDPLADKLLTSGVLIMLTSLGKVPGWLVFLIIGREIAITGLRSIAASQGMILNASRMGKNKMISQTIGLSFFLLAVPSIQSVLDQVGMLFLWISLLLGYWSAMGYFTCFYNEVRKQEHRDVIN